MAGGGQEAHGRPAEPAGLARRRGEGHEHHGAGGGYQVLSQSEVFHLYLLFLPWLLVRIVEFIISISISM